MRQHSPSGHELDRLKALAFVVVAFVLTGCPAASSFGQGEPCFFAFEDESMSGPAFCSIEMVTREPCRDIAECLCKGWLPSASEAELDDCAEMELDGDDTALPVLCGTEANLSVGAVVRSLAVIQDAGISMGGPCDTMPTYRYDRMLID